MSTRLKLAVWVAGILVLGLPALVGIICIAMVQQMTAWAFGIKVKR